MQEALVYLVLFLTALVVVWLIRRSSRRQEELFSHSLTGTGVQPAMEKQSPSPVVLRYLERRAVVAAALLARGIVEIERARMEDLLVESDARPTLNSMLRSAARWESLDPIEADLMGRPEGSWTSEQQMLVTVYSEELRLLRWVLGIDAELAPLAHCPKADLALALDQLRKRACSAAKGLPVESWDVRVHRDEAITYCGRVLAELRVRGVADPAYDTGDEDLYTWAAELRSKLIGASTDLVVGSETVEDIATNELILILAIASVRAQYAEYLIHQMDSAAGLSFRHRRTSLGDASGLSPTDPPD
ncbi:MAG: hypothetical protein IH602_03620 [Bryobacteraceae bacterium]|nr:hypothetical protein [Bryobacteraceae bacterium]